MKNIAAFIIGAQNDFAQANGKLSPPGGKGLEAVLTGANWIVQKKGHQILSDVYTAFDSHPAMHISLSNAIVDVKTGQLVPPYTVVTVEDVEGKRYRHKIPAFNERTQEYPEGYLMWYLKKLRDTTYIHPKLPGKVWQGRNYPHIAWPPHVLIGTSGQAMVPEMADALEYWCVRYDAFMVPIISGEDPRTEAFSLLMADVVLADNPKTDLNEQVLDMQEQHDEIVLMGLYDNFMLRWTTLDLARRHPEKLVLFTDCVASVPGYEDKTAAFIDECKQLGIRRIESYNYSA